MDSIDLKSVLKLNEELLKAQLKVVRRFMRMDGVSSKQEKTHKKGTSKIDLIHDILLSAQEPLHISEIIRRAEETFNVNLDRESMVSALTKKVKRGDTFVRVKPNTFSLIYHREKYDE